MTQGLQEQGAVPGNFNIDDVVALARQKMKSSSREALPPATANDILGGGAPVADKAYASVEELEAAQSRRDLPAREENVKSLGDLLAKYHVGEDPDFKALLYRVYPKVFPGGILAEGYYETYEQPFTEEVVAGAYGGGKYRVVIHGPRANSTHGTQHYASVQFTVAGEPRVDRVPRRGVVAETAPGAAPLQYQPPPSDRMVDRAFSSIQSNYEKERDERLQIRQEAERRQAEARREAEARQLEAVRAARESMDIIGAVHERHSQAIIESERAAHERERKLIEDRAQERESHLMEERQRYADEQRRREDERLHAPDPYDSIVKTAALFKGDGGESQQKILDSVLQKHRDEIAMFREESGRATARIQEANAHEAAALREAARREVEAERMAAASREKDLLRQIEQAREERQRDADRFREDIATRDQASRDRLDQQREMLNMQAESRYKTLETQNELRMTYLRDDNERKTNELNELRNSSREDKDPITAITRMKTLNDTYREAFGIEAPSNHAPEVAPTPTSFDWGKLGEAAMEKGPEYLEALGKLLRGPQAPPAAQTPPLQVGQILTLPNGVFQVVRTPVTQATPQGLGMIPYNPPAPTPTRLANPQRTRALPSAPDAQPQPRRSQPQPQPRPQAIPETTQADSPKTSKRPPRTAKPAPRPEPALEAAPAPPPVPKAPRPPPTDIEKQAAGVIGGMLEAAIVQGDEPEDLLVKIVGQFPEEMIKAVAQYEVSDILALIHEIQPNSAVFTPGGIDFTQTVFQQLRATLKM